MIAGAATQVKDEWVTDLSIVGTRDILLKKLKFSFREIISALRG